MVYSGVIKKCPKYFSQVSLFVKMQVNRFESVPVCDVTTGMSLQKLLAD